MYNFQPLLLDAPLPLGALVRLWVNPALRLINAKFKQKYCVDIEREDECTRLMQPGSLVA